MPPWVLAPNFHTSPPAQSRTRDTDYTERHGQNGIFGLYFRGVHGVNTWGSFWSHWGGLLTAHHVIEEMGSWSPQHPDAERSARFLRSPELKGPDGPVYLDAAFAGIRLPLDPPPRPERGMRIEVHGFPAGCTQSPEIRRGYVYLPSLGEGRQSYILVLDNDQVPVSGGMSGGVVYWSKEDGTLEPLGITIAMSSAFNADEDPLLEDNVSMTSLYHLWAAIHGKQMRYVTMLSPHELEIGEPQAADELPEGMHRDEKGDLYVDLGEIDIFNDPDVIVTELSASDHAKMASREIAKAIGPTRKGKGAGRRKSKPKSA